jgi:U-box domain
MSAPNASARRVSHAASATSRCGLQDPVSAPDGHVYERAAIEEWLRSGASSPFTSQPMSIGELRPVKGFGDALRLIQALSDDVATLSDRINVLHSVANQPLPMPRSAQLQD